MTQQPETLMPWTAAATRRKTGVVLGFHSQVQEVGCLRRQIGRI
jgi:hypothetical protein